MAEIVDVRTQLIKATSSTPIYGAIQDTLLGCYVMTHPYVKFNWRDYMNLAACISREEIAQVKKNKEYTGKQLFSELVPEKINFQKKSGGKVTFDITNGILTEGTVAKDLLGAGKNGLPRFIMDEYSELDAGNFLANAQRLACNFNQYYGFSYGLEDTDVSPAIIKKRNEHIKTKALTVQKMITESENNLNLMDPELLENLVMGELGTILTDVGEMVNGAMSKTNRMDIVINSGATGNKTNIPQICGALGQVSMEGERMKKKVNNRALPYFFQNDDTGPARGLVKHSFLEGFEWPEFVFHHMASREGLIDSAIKTAESGYVQRKLVKSMEDVVVRYDQTVRTSIGGIYQFIYGDNGINSTKQYAYNFELLTMNNKSMKERYLFDNTNNINKKYDNNGFFNKMIELRDKFRDIMTKSRLNFIALDTNVFIPVNIALIINNIKNYENGSGKLDADYVLEKIDNILHPNNTCLVTMEKKHIDDNTYIKYKDDQMCKLLFRTVLYENLAPKRCIEEYKLNKSQFDKICDHIILNFKKSRAEPGEMVGIIAAQSMGEGTTQIDILV